MRLGHRVREPPRDDPENLDSAPPGVDPDHPLARGRDEELHQPEDEEDARAKLKELYPVLVQMEKYGGGKKTRVVRVFRTDEEWKDGTPPT